jgi:hypothetical protein
MSYISLPDVGLTRPVKLAISRPFDLAVRGSKQIIGKNKWGRLALALHETLTTPYIAPTKSEPITLPPLPDHYQAEEVKLGNRDARIVISKSTLSKATFILPLGHGTNASHYIPSINYFNEHYADVRIMELTRPENNEHYADGTPITDGYDDIISNGLLNSSSPLLAGIPSYHSVYLITHSASGQSFERVIFSETSKAAFAINNFEHVFHTAIMLDTANSSHAYEPKFSKLYDWYSSHPNVRNQIAGTTPVDLEWLSGNIGINDKFFNNTSTNPLHGQAGALKKGGINHVNNVFSTAAEDTSIDFISIPRTFISGQDDPSACPLTARDYARYIRARFTLLKGVEHNPLTEEMRIAKTIQRMAFNSIPALHLNSIT